MPGPKNIVADALSRVPFANERISHRLIREPFKDLLNESVRMNNGSVQDFFRSSSASHNVQSFSKQQNSKLLWVSERLQVFQVLKFLLFLITILTGLLVLAPEQFV